MMDYQGLGKILKDIRIEKHFTTTELAKISGYTQAYISKLENGYIQKPSLDALSCLVEALGLTMAEFFTLLERKKDLIEVPLSKRDLAELKALLTNEETTDVQTKYQRLKDKLSQMFPELEEDTDVHRDNASQDL